MELLDLIKSDLPRKSSGRIANADDGSAASDPADKKAGGFRLDDPREAPAREKEGAPASMTQRSPSSFDAAGEDARPEADLTDAVTVMSVEDAAPSAEVTAPPAIEGSAEDADAPDPAKPDPVAPDLLTGAAQSRAVAETMTGPEIAQPAGPGPALSASAPEPEGPSPAAGEDAFPTAKGAPRAERALILPVGASAAAPAPVTPTAPPPESAGDITPDAALRIESAADIDNALTPSTPKAVTARTPAAAVAVAHELLAAVRKDTKTGAVEIRLDPPELGKVQLRFNFERADNAAATILAERSETLDLLRRHASGLLQDLERAGLTNVALEFSLSSDLEGFPGETSDAEAADGPDDAPSETRNLVYIARDGAGLLNRIV